MKKVLVFLFALLLMSATASAAPQTFSLDEMSLEEYKERSELFEADLYGEISLETCVGKRISKGSTGYQSVAEQIAYIEGLLQ